MSKPDKEDGKPIDCTAQVLGDIQKGAKFATSNYRLLLPSTGNNLVNVIDKTAGAIRNGKPKGLPVIRFDKAHVGTAFEHININPQISGVIDPHIRISPATLKGAQTVGKVAKVANKILLPAAIAIDGIRLGSNIHSDVTRGTTRNTVKTTASIAGGWGGGFGGASGGAAIGTLFFPGVGTLIGGIVGGIAGGVAGSMLSEGAVDHIGDSNEWDIEELKCKKCGARYKCRMYSDQSRVYCPKCSSK